MLNSVFRKITGDLLKSRGRALLTVFAMMLGVLGVGVVAFAFSILTREIDVNYMRTNPASASIFVENVNDEIVQKIKQRQDIADAEVRGFFKGRISMGRDQWKGLWLFAIPDFENMNFHLVFDEKAQGAPGKGEIYVENVALGVARAKVGESRTVVIPGFSPQKVRISGTIFDPGEAPAWMENTVYGYCTPETLAMVGPENLNELNILVTKENYFNYDSVYKITESVKSQLLRNGVKIIRTSVPRPGKHPHASQMSALLFLLQTFGLLVLVLASVLVVNLISSMIAGSTKEIGIMKATGAGTGQIFMIYFTKVLLMAIAAVIIGVPLANYLAISYAKGAAKMLNFRIFDTSVDTLYYIITIAAGLLIPLAASFFPIRKGVSITVQKTLSEYGISGGKLGSSSFINRTLSFLPLSGSMLYAVRNTFRNNVRLALTVLTLTIGGAVFLSSFNIGKGIRKTIEEFTHIIRYDIKLDVKDNTEVAVLENIVKGIAEVKSYEFWQSENAVITLPDGTSTDEMALLAPPENTKLFTPDMVEGEFLKEGETGTVVVRHILLAKNPSLSNGDTIKMTVQGKEVQVRIKGVSRFVGRPVIYTSPEMLNMITGNKSKARSIAIGLKNNDPLTIEETMKKLEKRCLENGIAVQSNSDMKEYRKILEDHFLIITVYLIMLSILIIIVGGLGLSTTMSVQVLERTREIGVLRAIGASNLAISGMVILEGLFIGLMSWLFSLLVALPVTKVIGDMFGMIFFGAKLSFAVDKSTMVLWLAIIMVFALISSIYPALRALRLSVRETLSYE